MKHHSSDDVTWVNYNSSKRMVSITIPLIPWKIPIIPPVISHYNMYTRWISLNVIVLSGSPICLAMDQNHGTLLFTPKSALVMGVIIPRICSFLGFNMFEPIPTVSYSIPIKYHGPWCSLSCHVCSTCFPVVSSCHISLMSHIFPDVSCLISHTLSYFALENYILLKVTPLFSWAIYTIPVGFLDES